MKEQRSNPLFEAAKHLLTPDGRYPASNCRILWQQTTELKIGNVEVMLVESDALRDKVLGPAYDNWRRNWRFWRGAGEDDWLHPGRNTPARVFGQLLDKGFIDQEHLIDAVREFAHIAECDWARDMLLELADQTT